MHGGNQSRCAKPLIRNGILVVEETASGPLCRMGAGVGQFVPTRFDRNCFALVRKCELGGLVNSQHRIWEEDLRAKQRRELVKSQDCDSYDSRTVLIHHHVVIRPL